MKKTEVLEGVVAEYNGKFWGIEYQDGYCTCYNFVDISRAQISNPEFCHKPTDMTYEGSHYIEQLNKARLVKLRKTITTEFELL